MTLHKSDASWTSYRERSAARVAQGGYRDRTSAARGGGSRFIARTMAVRSPMLTLPGCASGVTERQIIEAVNAGIIAGIIARMEDR